MRKRTPSSGSVGLPSQPMPLSGRVVIAARPPTKTLGSLNQFWDIVPSLSSVPDQVAKTIFGASVGLFPSGGRFTSVISTWKTASFRGRIGDQAIEDSIHNGTWTGFIHTKRDAAVAGSAGAVILQNADDIEFFAGWQNPWRRGDSQVFVEIKEFGYWWTKKSQDAMLAILDDHKGQKHKAYIERLLCKCCVPSLVEHISHGWGHY
ncbi:hypothetical protein FB451DRAFT_1467770 [Mycena latifolia]|nr:hypothetical protein FB451DRAFT_1467770 [Mycena latifolia]